MNSSYLNAGVNIELAEKTVRTVTQLADSTMISGVLGKIGGFGGLFEISKEYENPVLVSGTDGVGTKLLIAQRLNKHNTIGIGLVLLH